MVKLPGPQTIETPTLFALKLFLPFHQHLLAFHAYKETITLNLSGKI